MGEEDAVMQGGGDGSGTAESLPCPFGRTSIEAEDTGSTTANRAPHVGQVLREALVNCSRARIR